MFSAFSSRQKFCCESCNNVAKSNHRKAILRRVGGEMPSLGEVHARDGGRCQLCGKRVSLQYNWPDGRTASLDHIVPLSRGGRDDGRNIQLAHLRCNIRKQSKPLGQLRLFA
jgi:5-methylcytosine-specific restriction endonuclease McrA